MDYFNTRSLAESRNIPVKHFGFPRSAIPERLNHQRCYDSRGYDYAPKYHDQLLERDEAKGIIAHFEKDSKFYNVGVQGLPSNTEVGSRRVTVYDEGFSEFMTRKLYRSLTPVILDEFSPVDWQSQNPDKLNYWVPLGVSTVFRYMRYGKGGEHFTHYDAPFVDPENPLIRTLKSGVLYLSDSFSCRTCFVDDQQADIPFVERDHSDWERKSREDEFVGGFRSSMGSVLTFFHQLPHFVSAHRGDEDRIIIRFDVTYKAVGKI